MASVMRASAMRLGRPLRASPAAAVLAAPLRRNFSVAATTAKAAAVDAAGEAHRAPPMSVSYPGEVAPRIGNDRMRVLVTGAGGQVRPTFSFPVSLGVAFCPSIYGSFLASVLSFSCSTSVYPSVCPLIFLCLSQ